MRYWLPLAIVAILASLIESAPISAYQNYQCAIQLYCSPNDPPLESLEQAPPVVVKYGWRCSCIQAVRKFGVHIPKGTNAGDLISNAGPAVGHVVLLKYDLPHVAVIIGMTETTLTIREGNYEKCAITERIIDQNDPRIRGYWSAP